MPTHQPVDVRVLIADDHQALLERVVSLLATEFTVVGAVHDGIELVEAEAALAQGAKGYVNKTCLARDLVPAIHAALEGRFFVSHLDAPTRTPA